jgi:hypothetical protein
MIQSTAVMNILHVTFDVNLYERGEAEASLHDNSNDIAIVFEPIHLSELQMVYSEPQQVYCIMSLD